MQKTKKIMAVTVALIMMFSLSICAAASTFTVNNASEGVTYEIYKILDLDYDATTQSYAYSAPTKWSAFAQTYFNAENGFITGINSSYTVANVAKAAASNVDSNSITPDATVTVSADDINSAEIAAMSITSLDPGYYLITSSLNNGATSMLANTVDGNLEITEKNILPTITKDANAISASIGDEIEYTVAIYCEEDAQNSNYVIHDYMTGVTLKKIDKVTLTDADGNVTTLTKDTDYTLSKDGNDCGYASCSFEIAIADTLTIAAGDKIEVTYTGTITDSNPTNKALLSSTNNPVDTPDDPDDEEEIPEDNDGEDDDENIIYTYDFTLTKINDSDNALSGAEFTLTKAESGTTYYATVDADGNFAGWTTTKTSAATFTTDASGKIYVSGLAEGTYTLTETKAPTGYVLPANATVTVVIAADSTDKAQHTVTASSTGLEVKANGTAGFNVVNSSTQNLPATGGTGVVFFYIAGALLVVTAGVVLVIRKRAAV